MSAMLRGAWCVKDFDTQHLARNTENIKTLPGNQWGLYSQMGEWQLLHVQWQCDHNVVTGQQR